MDKEQLLLRVAKIIRKECGDIKRGDSEYRHGMYAGVRDVSLHIFEMLYKEYDPVFAEKWIEETREPISEVMRRILLRQAKGESNDK